MLDCCVEKRPNNSVHCLGKHPDACQPIFSGKQFVFGIRPGRCEPVAQDRHHRLPLQSCITGAGRRLFQHFGKRVRRLVKNLCGFGTF